MEYTFLFPLFQFPHSLHAGRRSATRSPRLGWGRKGISIIKDGRPHALRDSGKQGRNGGRIGCRPVIGSQASWPVLGRKARATPRNPADRENKQQNVRRRNGAAHNDPSVVPGKTPLPPLGRGPCEAGAKDGARPLAKGSTAVAFHGVDHLEFPPPAVLNSSSIIGQNPHPPAPTGFCLSGLSETLPSGLSLNSI